MATSSAQTIQAGRDSFIRFATRHNIIVNHHSDWRCVTPKIGQVRGLHTLRGKLVATNGILAYLEQPDTLSLIHLANFVPDPVEKAPSQGRARKQNNNSAELFAALLA